MDMALGVIGQGVKTVRKVQLQRELGNIEADVEDNGIVLTHTCKDTSPGDRWSPCSSNGSSLGQRARAKHARGRITPERMPGEDVSARAVALRPAGRRATHLPAWLAARQGGWKNNIQGEGEPAVAWRVICSPSLQSPSSVMNQYAIVILFFWGSLFPLRLQRKPVSEFASIRAIRVSLFASAFISVHQRFTSPGPHFRAIPQQVWQDPVRQPRACEVSSIQHLTQK